MVLEPIRLFFSRIPADPPLRVAIFDPPVSEADLVRHMHTVKESLLVADDLAREVSRKVDECISEYRALGELKSSMSVFPHVHDLDQMVGAFLGAANRSLKLVCEIANQFLPLERRHQNFSKLAAAIAKEVPTCAPILSFLREWEDCSAYISDLRNFFEHPRAIRTVLHNFDLVGDGIRTPQWHIEGDRVTSPRPIKEESQKMVVLLLDFSEAMFFLLMQWRLDRRYPFALSAYPVSDQIAGKFILTIDPSKVAW